jgi:hypothetical protein
MVWDKIGQVFGIVHFRRINIFFGSYPSENITRTHDDNVEARYVGHYGRSMCSENGCSVNYVHGVKSGEGRRRPEARALANVKGNVVQ